MFPCGFYDLRDAAPAPVPVVSTAFRPARPRRARREPVPGVHLDAGPRGPALLRPATSRTGCAASSRPASSSRPSCSRWPTSPSSTGSFTAADADRYLELAAASFALSTEPVDRAWYAELERVSGVAADIGGVTTTHINHLTPRVLDIDDLYASMQARGIEMIDEIQGPPRWDGPDVLLRQTSFRALAEPRTFRDCRWEVSQGALRVRFGEVEARGIALTPAGSGRVSTSWSLPSTAASPTTRTSDRADVAPQVWEEGLPATERDLCLAGSGSSRFASSRTRRPGARRRSRSPRSREGTRRRLVRPVCCVPSRSSTRTSCRVRPPASSPRTWPTAGP